MWRFLQIIPPKGSRLIAAMALIFAALIGVLGVVAFLTIQNNRPWNPVSEWTNPMPVEVRDQQLYLGGEVCNRELTPITVLVTVVWIPVDPRIPAEPFTINGQEFTNYPIPFDPGCTNIDRAGLGLPIQENVLSHVNKEWVLNITARPIGGPRLADTIEVQSETFELL